jgi:ribosomal protein L37AE/L43A
LEKTKRFLELCSPEVHDYVTTQVGLYIKAHPTSPLTKERQDRWDRFIASDPILQRVIYYTYSPADAIELRYDEMRSATDINLANDGCYIDFALNDSGFPNDALLRDFLEKMKFDMDRVSAADNWKREGAKESIEELRRTCFYGKTWEDGDGCKITKVIIDQSFSDGYRDELIAKRHPDGTITEEYHTHILSKDEPDTSRFIDETLIRWMKLFEDDEDLRESAYSRVVCPSCDYKNVLSSYGTFQCSGCGHRFTGEEVKDKEDYVHVHKISGEIEKIPFGLERKYRPLRGKIHRKYHFEREAYWEDDDRELEQPLHGRDRIDRHWDLEQIFREEILKWDEKTPPPAYFANALEWGIKNMGAVYKDRLGFRKRFEEKEAIKEAPIKCKNKECGLYFPLSESKGGEDCPWCENPIDPQDLVKEIKTFTLMEDKDFEAGSLDELVVTEDRETARKVDLFQGKAGVSPMGFDPNNLKIFSTKLDYSHIMKEQENRVFETEILRLIDHLDHPVDKALLVDFYDYCCCDRKPTSHAEMSRLLKREGIPMTAQQIARRRKKLLAPLQERFSK